MVRVSESTVGGTGDGPAATANRPRLGLEYGRKAAVDIVTDRDSGASVASDGGLSPAARAWMDATPGVDVEDARRYDRETRLAREIARTGDLPPRGDRGDPDNYDRADVVNTARNAVREYRKLEDRSE